MFTITLLLNLLECSLSIPLNSDKTFGSWKNPKRINVVSISCNRNYLHNHHNRSGTILSRERLFKLSADRVLILNIYVKTFCMAIWKMQLNLLLVNHNLLVAFTEFHILLLLQRVKVCFDSLT